MQYNRERALELLRYGCDCQYAQFKVGQEEAIRYVIEGNGRLLNVQATGWGKTFVYFIACKLLREAFKGPTLVISPLIALMRNQVEAAKKIGVNAITLNSSNESELSKNIKDIKNNKVDLLIISPEKLSNEYFINKVLLSISLSISLLVIDEAHCISDWGHDFRPEYRLIERQINLLPTNMRLLATTATANVRVIEDLKEVLGNSLKVIRGDLYRPSLCLQTISFDTELERLAWLAEQVTKIPGCGIIYVLTIKTAKLVSDWLKNNGLNVEAYWGNAKSIDREDLENKLLNNQIKALVSTSALGMGFDKPDIGFVIHYQAPGSVISYYQQVGRAGRKVEAYGTLLNCALDWEINEYFIDYAFPKKAEVDQLLNLLSESLNGFTINEILTKLNIKKSRLDKTLNLLSIETDPPIVKQDKNWKLTIHPINKRFWERIDRLTNVRYNELEQMKKYIKLKEKHMEFLINALDCDSTSDITPSIPLLTSNVSDIYINKSKEFISNRIFVIDSRKKWPDQGLPEYNVSGNISKEYQSQQGRTLCICGDNTYWEQIKKGKYKNNYFSDELVTACANMVIGWRPEPKPTWVTCIPSLRHRILVPDFAKRLAKALNLPFIETLVKVEERPNQKDMANSVLQARNLDGAIYCRKISIPAEPVLLVDDMVDSRWTFTIASWLLQLNGCGKVFPIALANTGNDD